MNPQDQLTFSAVYIPQESKIVFFEGDRISHGFIGSMATEKYLEALKNNINIIITEPEMSNNTDKIRQFRAILAKKGLMNIKADILDSYGVESSKQLSSEQLDQIIDKLNATDVSAQVRQSRSKLLNLLDRLGVKGNSELGWDRVNSYLCNPRIAGKPLYEMSTSEMEATITKLRAIIHKSKQNQ